MAFWNKKIINLDDRYLGLDLSDFSAKVFQLEKNGDSDRIRSYNSGDIKAGYIEDGRIVNQEKVAEIIRDIIKEAGPKKINTKKVICSIPESKVFLRIISIPKVSLEEASEAIKWEIEPNIPLPVDQVYYDWQFLNEEDGKQNILTVAVVKDIADNLIKTMEQAGLSVYGLEMESVATVRSIVPQNSIAEKTYLIVDLGGEKTSFIITEDSIPYFTSSIPFSASNITQAITDIFSVNLEEAEKIKINYGIERSFKNNSIFDSIRPLLENVSKEIEKTMDFYQNLSQSKNKIGKIIISGGGANLKGLVPYFTLRLGKETILGDPWINLNLGKRLPPISRENSIRYATVIGLAMRNNL